MSSIEAVEKCCKKLGIDFYIIGALAKNIWFMQGGIPSRGTKDDDFAVFVSEEKQFHDLKSLLIDKFGFLPVKDNEFALTGNSDIDILPFGKIEVEDGVAVVRGKGLNNIKVNGFKEVYEVSVEKVVWENKPCKVATLSGIVLLKLISHDDRPELRLNDPLDILSIIENFFELHTEVIYNEHNDLFGDETMMLKMISARVVGREMRKPLRENAELKARIIKILEDHIALGEKSEFILRMASIPYIEVELCVRYLQEILAGIKEKK